MKMAVARKFRVCTFNWRVYIHVQTSFIVR
jgi:hypothetical protein